MRGALILLLIVPHLAIFLYAARIEWRRWKALDAEDRPSFLGYLGRQKGPEDRPLPKHVAERRVRIDKTQLAD